MKEETKIILLFVISIILFGLFLTIYIVDQKIVHLILTIVALLMSLGSAINYYIETKDNIKPINKKKKRK